MIFTSGIMPGREQMTGCFRETYGKGVIHNPSALHSWTRYGAALAAHRTSWPRAVKALANPSMDLPTPERLRSGATNRTRSGLDAPRPGLGPAGGRITGRSVIR